jgi:hypothetical protein
MCERSRSGEPVGETCPLDFVLRATFEWRELANLLADTGSALPLRLRKRPASAAGAAGAGGMGGAGAEGAGPRDRALAEAHAASDGRSGEGPSEAAMARMTYRGGLALAHRSRPFARRLVELLGRWYAEPIACVRSAGPAELQAVLRRPLRTADVGLFWALLSDPRPDVAATAHAWRRHTAARGP